MRILIIGMGSIARKHVQAIRNLIPDAVFYALRSTANAEEKPGIKNIYSYSELDAKIDFVIVSNPTALHYTTLTQASELNCPLFIEKPAVDHIQEGKILAELFHKKNTMTYVGFNLRFLPCLQYLKTNLQKSARINEVNVYCGSYLPDWRPGIDFRKNYSANREMGGGAHLDLIHELDYVYWLFGKPLKTEKRLSSSSSLHITAIDYANYCLTYQEFSVNIILNYYRRDAKRSCEVVMEEDTWYVNLLENSVVSFKNGKLFHSDFDRTELYTLQMKQFIEAVTDGKSSSNSFHDSMNVLEICLDETT